MWKANFRALVLLGLFAIGGLLDPKGLENKLSHATAQQEGISSANN